MVCLPGSGRATDAEPIRPERAGAAFGVSHACSGNTRESFCLGLAGTRRKQRGTRRVPTNIPGWFCPRTAVWIPDYRNHPSSVEGFGSHARLHPWPTRPHRTHHMPSPPPWRGRKLAPGHWNRRCHQAAPPTKLRQPPDHAGLPGLWPRSTVPGLSIPLGSCLSQLLQVEGAIGPLVAKALLAQRYSSGGACSLCPAPCAALGRSAEAGSNILAIANTPAPGAQCALGSGLNPASQNPCGEEGPPRRAGIQHANAPLATVRFQTIRCTCFWVGGSQRCRLHGEAAGTSPTRPETRSISRGEKEGHLWEITHRLDDQRQKVDPGGRGNRIGRNHLSGSWNQRDRRRCNPAHRGKRGCRSPTCNRLSAGPDLQGHREAATTAPCRNKQSKPWARPRPSLRSGYDTDRIWRERRRRAGATDWTRRDRATTCSIKIPHAGGVDARVLRLAPDHLGVAAQADH